MPQQIFKHDELSAVQWMAIELLVQKAIVRMTFRDISQKLEIDERTLLRWRANPVFREALRVRSIEALGDSTHEVLATLTRKAIAGDNKAIQMYLQVTGLLAEGAVLPKAEEPDPRSNEAIERDIEELERELRRIAGEDENTLERKVS